MSERARRVLIIANLGKEATSTTAEDIRAYLDTLAIPSEAYFYSGDPDGPPKTDNVSLIVSLGGDGTVLYAARVAAPLGIPIIPVNMGHLGFIAEFSKWNWKAALDQWFADTLPLSKRVMLKVEVCRSGDTVADFHAMNDITVSAQGIAKLIGFSLRIGKSSVVRYRADGVIFATPTGSTAYNLAAGGPVLHPEMDAMIINPVCPFTLSNRPLVVPSWERIELSLDEGNRPGAMLTIDGQVTFTLQYGDRIRISGAPEKAFIHVSENFAFYELLRSKLAWSGGAGA